MELEKIKLVGVIDDNLEKQDKFLPGSAIPIVSTKKVLAQLEQNNPTTIYCLVFAWNIGIELLEKLREKFPSGTKVVQFMPEVSSVEL
jgi:hypothetical protein